MKTSERLQFGDVVRSRTQHVMVVQPKSERSDFAPGWFTGILLTPQTGLRKNNVGQVAQYHRLVMQKVD